MSGPSLVRCTPPTDIMDLRTVVVRGALYLRVEDVASLIMEVGGTEPTDTRNRLNELAHNLAALRLRHPEIKENSGAPYTQFG